MDMLTSNHQSLLNGYASVSIVPLSSSNSAIGKLPSSTSFDKPAANQIDLNAECQADFVAELKSVLHCAYRVAFHLTNCATTAEDLVQDAALIGYSRFSTFKPGTNFKAWYLRILKNCFLMNIRKQKKSPFCVELSTTIGDRVSAEASFSQANLETTDPATNFTRLIKANQIAAEMNRLPPEYRLVCVFSLVLELSYNEISDQLQIPVGTVRSRLHRGRKLLQQRLGRQD